jgi:hypothetical protein
MIAVVALLVAQLAILGDSRDHIVAQDRKVNRILKESGPVLGELEPVLRDLPATARDVRGAVRLLRSGQLVDLVDLSTQLVRGLRDSEFIPRTLRAADVVPGMAAILRETLEVQRAVLAIQRDTLSTQLRSYRINRKNRRTQKRSLAILERSLAIQEESLTHIRSIDRKTGGPAPAAPVPAPPR